MEAVLLEKRAVARERSRGERLVDVIHCVRMASYVFPCERDGHWQSISDQVRRIWQTEPHLTQEEDLSLFCIKGIDRRNDRRMSVLESAFSRLIGREQKKEEAPPPPPVVQVRKGVTNRDIQIKTKRQEAITLHNQALEACRNGKKEEARALLEEKAAVERAIVNLTATKKMLRTKLEMAENADDMLDVHDLSQLLNMELSATVKKLSSDQIDSMIDTDDTLLESLNDMRDHFKQATPEPDEAEMDKMMGLLEEELQTNAYDNMPPVSIDNLPSVVRASPNANKQQRLLKDDPLGGMFM